MKNWSWWQRALQFFGRADDVPAVEEPVLPVFVPEVVLEYGEFGSRASCVLPGGRQVVHAVRLRQQMLNFLTEGDLRALATAVSIDYDALPGGKGRRVFEMVELCAENGRLTELYQLCQTTHPDIDWQPEWQKDDE